MHVNYRYALSKAAQHASAPDTAILDYGCGEGEVVEEGRKMGLNIYGVETFYEGSSSKGVVEKKGLLGHTVRMIENGIIPFGDEWFDFVISNMVFEHVEDLDAVLREIHRVLKPGGRLLCLFPCQDAIRESHCGLPLIHRFSKTSRLRFYYAVALRSLGFGTFKDARSIRTWVNDHLAWLDRFVHLRDRRTIQDLLGRYFAVSFIESDYLAFRLAAQGRIMASRVVRWKGAQPFVHELLRRVAALVIVGTKRSNSDLRETSERESLRLQLAS